MAELKLTLSVDDSAAVTDLKNFQKIVEGIQKQILNMPLGGGKVGAGGAMPKPDMSAFQDYKAAAALARVETTRLGRELDALNAKYGVGSAEARAFSQAQLENNKVLKVQQSALMSLKQAYQGGSIGLKQYQLETAKLISQQELFKNKMNMATPIRAMQGDLSQVQDVLGRFFRTFSANLPGMQTMFDILPAGLNAVGLKIPELSGQFMGLNGAVQAANTGIISLLANLGKIALFSGVVAGVFGAALVGGGAIKAGKEFEDMEFQMASLINASTKFKDQATGQFVGFEKNLQLSLEHGKQLISQFAKDAPGLAGTNLQELTQTAAISVGNLAGNGVIKAIDQAKIIEGLTVAVKTVTRGMANQLPSEIRGVINEDFRKNNTLINQIADKVGGKDRYKQLAAEAKARGEYGQFLLKALDPYVRAANFASNSLSNLQEIFTDTLTNFNRLVAGGGLFEVFKQIPRQLLGTFVELDNPAIFGQLKGNIQQLAISIGSSLKNAVQAIVPLMPLIAQFGVLFLSLIPPVTQLATIFLTLGSNVLSGVLLPVLTIVINLFNTLNAFISPIASGLSSLIPSVNGINGAVSLLLPTVLGLAAAWGIFQAKILLTPAMVTGLMASLQTFLVGLPMALSGAWAGFIAFFRGLPALFMTGLVGLRALTVQAWAFVSAMATSAWTGLTNFIAQIPVILMGLTTMTAQAWAFGVASLKSFVTAIPAMLTYVGSLFTAQGATALLTTLTAGWGAVAGTVVTVATGGLNLLIGAIIAATVALGALILSQKGALDTVTPLVEAHKQFSAENESYIQSLQKRASEGDATAQKELANLQTLSDQYNNLSTTAQEALQSIVEGTAVSSAQAMALWNSNVFNPFQKANIWIRGAWSVTTSAISSWWGKAVNFLGNAFSKFFNWLADKFKAITSWVGGVLSGLGPVGQAMLGVTSGMKNINTKIITAGFQGLSAPKSGGGGGTGGFTPTSSFDKADPEKKKGKKGPSQESLDRKADADLERENKKKTAQEALDLAIKEREEAEKLIQTKEALNKKEAEIFEQRLESSRYALGADQAAHENDLEKKRIDNARKNKQITEEQKNALLEQNAIKKIELDYQNQLQAIAQKNLEVKRKELALEEAIAEATRSRQAITGQIQSKQTQLETLQNEFTGGQFKTDKARDEAEVKILNLKAEIEKLNKQLAEIVSSSKEKIDKAAQDVRQGKQDVALETQKAQQERSQALETVSMDYSQMAQENAKEQKKALIDGAKEIFTSIKNAFSDGKVTLEEIIGIIENVFNKIGSLFGKDGKLGGGGGSGGGLGSIFGGIFKLFGKGGKGKSGGGAMPALDEFGMVPLGNNTSMDPKQWMAEFGGGGAGGLLGKMGGAGGMAGGIMTAATTALSIGMGVFSFFQARAKKKKEAAIKKQIQEIENITKTAFNQIDLMEQALQQRMQDFKDKLDDLNREIRRIDVGTSLYMGSKVIEKTTQQIQLTINEIGQGSKLVINTSYWNAYWQNMQVFSASVQGLEATATGLYAERNRQIQTLLDARAAVVASLTNNGEVERAAFEQMDAISRKIVEVNNDFNNQIRDMTNQRKDLEESLAKALEQQKQNYLTWSRRIQKEIISVQFGEGSGQMFDSMIEVVDQIREVLISGIDPRLANFLIQRLKEQATNKLKNQYRDFIEGVNDNYLKSITDLQDRLQAVISEGRITGRIKKTQTQKLQEIQREIDKLVGEQVSGTSLDLRQFGISVDSATNSLDALTNLMNKNITDTLNQVAAGQYRTIDAVNVNAIFSPEVIASEVQRQLDARLNTPALATTVLI